MESAARLDQNEEDLFRLAERVLSSRELAVWQSLPHPVPRRAPFLRAWTRKEAYARAMEQGVFDKLAGLEVTLDARAPARSLIIRSGSTAGLTSVVILHDLRRPKVSLPRSR